MSRDGIRLAHRVRDSRANRRNHCKRAVLGRLESWLGTPSHCEEGGLTMLA
jgi:hypothetical protein